MQIKLKTQFWKCQETEEWIKRYNKLNEGNTLVFVAILAGLIFKIPTMIAIAATIMLTLSIIITVTHNIHKKREREEQDGKDTNNEANKDK